MDNISQIVSLFFTVLSIAIIGRALLSWFDPAFRSSIGKLIYDITEPIISPIRQVLPTFGALDLSPIVALVLIQVLSRLINAALT